MTAVSTAPTNTAPTTTAPFTGSIEDLSRRLLAEANATRCVAYRCDDGELVFQGDVEAAGFLPQADYDGPAVQITEPVRDAFGRIIGVIQTRESSDPTSF
ncbi:MAG: hypothetical protein AAF567_17195 [Actinomycetota bacterium]